MDRTHLIIGILVCLVAVTGLSVATAISPHSEEGTVELDEALENQEVSTQLSFTFTAEDDDTVEATVPDPDDDQVHFEFEEWVNLSSGESGDESDWDVTEDHEYQVTVSATAETGAEAMGHEETVQIAYVGDEADDIEEDLTLHVEHVEPEFGNLDPAVRDLTFHPDNLTDDTMVIEKSYDIPNVGDGVMVIGDIDDIHHTSPSFNIEVITKETPGEIAPGESGELVLEYHVDLSADDDSYNHEITVEDNLDNVEIFTADIDVHQPAFGDISADSFQVVFDPDQFVEEDTMAVSHAISIPNDGDGYSSLSEFSFSGVPADVDVSTDDLDMLIDPDDEEELTLDFLIDADAGEGVHDLTVTVEDYLGNTESFDVEVEVFIPPVVEFANDPHDLGDVVAAGEAETFTVEVTEQTGYQSLDGIEVALPDTEEYIDIEVNEPAGFGAGPGGSDTFEVIVEVDEGAPQHEDLSWDLEVRPAHEHGFWRDATLEAHIIHPPRLGPFEVEANSMHFDVPQDEADFGEFQQTQTIEIENEGDLTMDVHGIDGTVERLDGAPVTGSFDIEATTLPDTVDGLDSAEVVLDITAGSDVEAGEYELDIDIETDGGTEDATATFEITHEVGMWLESTTIPFGEVEPALTYTESTTVAEAYQYRDLEGVTFELVDGPEQWLEVTSAPPATIEAGENIPLEYEIQFDVDAQPYTEYTWTFVIDADEVDARTIDVSAVPTIPPVESVADDLDDRAVGEDWQIETADGLATLISVTHEGLVTDDTDVTLDDFERLIAIGELSVGLFDSIEAAQELQQDGEFEEAHSSVTSTVVPFRLLVDLQQDIEHDELTGDLEEMIDHLESEVDAVMETQRGYYQDILDDDPTLVEEAFAYQNLARLEQAMGNAGQASTYQQQSDELFGQYRETVEEGMDIWQTADDELRQLEDDATLSLLGQPFVLNPARLDEVENRIDDIEESYALAEEQLLEAGETLAAADVADDLDDAQTQLMILQWTLYGVTAILGLAFLGLILRWVMNSITFVREAREAAAGAFLIDE